MTSIAWQRRVEYTIGYLQLGMIDAAAEELSLVPEADRRRPEVLAAWCDVYSEGRKWRRMVEVGQELARIAPDNSHGWISWAFALRELQRIAEAQAILREAEAHHPACGVLHYNLACYACLLGDTVEAERRLRRALAIDRAWKKSALDDSDLAALRDRISRL